MSKIKNMAIDQLNQVKERPILFNKEMISALVAGRKSQTRRVMKDEGLIEFFGTLEHITAESRLEKTLKRTVTDKHPQTGKHEVPCPYGQIGDRLYVREAWRYLAPDGPETLCVGFADGYQVNIHPEGYELAKKKMGRWWPSIHLKKSVSRIWLEITDIKVERLQSLSDDDAVAEGIQIREWDDLTFYKNYWHETNKAKDFISASRYGFENGKQEHSAPVASYCSLWCDINGIESWNANPWIWVVSFKILSTTGYEDIAEEGAAS